MPNLLPCPGGVRVALRWLAAVKAKERKAAVDLMGAPFVARGWLDNPGHASQLADRGATNRAPPKKWPDTALPVADRAALPAAFDCLLLPEYDKRIPDLVAGRWPPDRGNPWDREVGAIFPVEPSKVSRRVRRFAKEAGELARRGTLLQAVAVDNNGFTFTVLLVVMDGRIRAAFADQMFEE